MHKDSIANLNISLYKGFWNRSIYEIYIVFLQLNPDLLIGRAIIGEVNTQIKKSFLDNSSDMSILNKFRFLEINSCNKFLQSLF